MRCSIHRPEGPEVAAPAREALASAREDWALLQRDEGFRLILARNYLGNAASRRSALQLGTLNIFPFLKALPRGNRYQILGNLR